MQLTSKDGNMVVDFYPQAFIANDNGGCEVKRFVKCVTFMNDQKSYSVISKSTMNTEVADRISYGYSVTDIHTEKYSGPYMPVAC